MALDRSKLHKGFQTYLANAEQASGKTYEDFSLALAKSGLKKHGELRSYLMEAMGLGHGHANAVVAVWLLPGNGGPAPAAEKSLVKASMKGPGKAPAKGPVKKPARTPASKPAKAPPRAPRAKK